MVQDPAEFVNALCRLFSDLIVAGGVQKSKSKIPCEVSLFAAVLELLHLQHAQEACEQSCMTWRLSEE